MNETTKPIKAKKETSTTEKKKRSVNWLGERLVEKIDRDHYMCIICFKRILSSFILFFNSINSFISSGVIIMATPPFQ